MTKSVTRLIHSFLDVRTMLKDLWQSMDKVCLIEVECVRKEFQGERCSHSFSQTLSLVLYKQSQSQFSKTPPFSQFSPNFSIFPKLLLVDGNLCFQEEVPVDEKIPHCLNTGCRHCGNLFEPVREESESLFVHQMLR